MNFVAQVHSPAPGVPPVTRLGHRGEAQSIRGMGALFSRAQPLHSGS